MEQKNCEKKERNWKKMGKKIQIATWHQGLNIKKIEIYYLD